MTTYRSPFNRLLTATRAVGTYMALCSETHRKIILLQERKAGCQGQREKAKPLPPRSLYTQVSPEASQHVIAEKLQGLADPDLLWSECCHQ